MFKEGSVFGKLTLVSFHGRNKHSKKEWLCKCECGNSCIRVEGNLKTTKVPHCGCSPAWKGTNSRFVDLTGKEFGRLKVIMHYGKNKHSQNLWYCECKCGEKTTITTRSLESGHTKSCGCLKKDYLKETYTTHGYTGERLYKTYNGMLARCRNEKEPCYKDYGGRGISVCDEWLDFIVFKDWSLSNGYSEELTIDRIDVNGNYEPSNCRWTDLTTQANNKRSNVILEYKGENKTIAEWCKYLGIDYNKFYHQLSKGKTIEEIINLNSCK